MKLPSSEIRYTGDCGDSPPGGVDVVVDCGGPDEVDCDGSGVVVDCGGSVVTVDCGGSVVGVVSVGGGSVGIALSAN